MKNLIKSESAVSEAVSFILVFAIVSLSSAIIFLAGSPMLDKSQKTTHFQEMEKSFSFLSQNIERVGSDRAPIRTTELKIKGGTLTVAHNSTITVGDIPFSLGSIEYIYEGKTLAYENGGLWTKYPEGAVVMISKPSISVGNITTIPALELIGDAWVGGDGIMRINAESHSSSLYSINATDGKVPVMVQSSYYKGWAEYLEEIGAEDIALDDANTTVLSNITADVVNVDSNQITIKIQTG